LSQYDFDRSARQLFDAAGDDARRRGHGYIGTEHLLSAMLDDAHGAPFSILNRLNVDIPRLRQKLDATVKTGNAENAGAVLPYTSRAKMVLELAIDEARSFRDDSVGAGHVLVGLLIERRGLAAQLLTEAGVSPSGLRLAWRAAAESGTD
jgi:ATP-dependent Clp protease ATP-binding subunit ClpC